jgi:hypothetical protein
MTESFASKIQKSFGTRKNAGLAKKFVSLSQWLVHLLAKVRIGRLSRLG